MRVRLTDGSFKRAFFLRRIGARDAIMDAIGTSGHGPFAIRSWAEFWNDMMSPIIYFYLRARATFDK